MREEERLRSTISSLHWGKSSGGNEHDQNLHEKFFNNFELLSETIMDEFEEKVFTKEEVEERLFSNNTRDYNRISCSACNAVVKVHHLRRHLQNHNLTVDQYKDIYGSQYQYVLCSWHRCGICDMEMLFDLDTLYAHVNSLHNVKIKDYVDQYLTTEDSKPKIAAIDADGAPLLALQKRGMTVTVLPNSSKQSNLITHLKKKETKRKPFEAKFDPQSRKTVHDFSTGYLERVQERDEDGYLISNDLADYMLVECQICNLQKPMTQLRSHTKAAHGITITEYKAQFGSDLEPVEPVYHRCGVCSQIIFLDSDAVATHLKSGGHPRITHKDYNDTFMVDTRSSRQYVTPQEKEFRAEQRLLQSSPTMSHRGLGGSVRGSVMRSTSSPMRGEQVVCAQTKMVPSRGRGWTGVKRGRGRPVGGSLKRSYEDDSYEYEADSFESGSEVGHSRKSRRRARMGEGAYSEKSYDALLRMQQQEFENKDEWGSTGEEWQDSSNYEEDWGEDAWNEAKQEKEEEEDDGNELNPEVEYEDEEEDQNFPTEDSNSTSSFGKHATKSLDLGPRKLEVILLDNDADKINDAEKNEAPEDDPPETPMFNFSTFSSYNDKVMKARSESTDHEIRDASREGVIEHLNAEGRSTKEGSELCSLSC